LPRTRNPDQETIGQAEARAVGQHLVGVGGAPLIYGAKRDTGALRTFGTANNTT